MKLPLAVAFLATLALPAAAQLSEGVAQQYLAGAGIGFDQLEHGRELEAQGHKH